MDKYVSIHKMSLDVAASIKEALHIIGAGEAGICFILSEKKLVGVLTDGDVRRALINGVSIDDTVNTVMTSDFCSLSVNSSLTKIQDKLRLFKCIPIVNHKGELVDLATSQRYHQIPLIQPLLNGNELEYVTDCIQTSWISSQGKYVTLFEQKFGEYVGSPRTLAVSNGTVALHLALVALGVGPGDEVIVPDLTFAATLNSILYTGATPVLVDVDPKTMVINVEQVSAAITHRTRAIMPVHLYGYPVNLDRLLAIASDCNLLVIEDCAEALGSFYRGTHVGTTCDASIFSFFGNKTITTGEGGMVIFQSTAVLERARILRDHGMSPSKRYWHEVVGFNYRMTNIQAAIGVAQLENITYILDRKRWIASIYEKYLAGISHLQLPTDPEESQSFNSYWLYTIVLNPPYDAKRDNVLNYLQGTGIEARPVFFPIHLMPPYQIYSDSPHNFNCATSLSAGGISLPSSVSITELEIEYVCSSLRAALLD